MLPLKLSQKPFCIGFPGAMKCQATLLSCAQANMASEVNSVPLSETIMPGLPRRLISRQFPRHAPAWDRGVRDLVLELLQPFGLADIHPALLGLPVVKRRFRHAMLARQIPRLRPGLVLL